MARRGGGAGQDVGEPLTGPVSTIDPAHVRRARSLATLLDNAVRIPGLGVRVGLDPLLGIIPGLGDFVGAGVSAYIIVLAARAGAPPSVLARMVGNVAVDTLVGSVPAVGDLFDFGWKANARNVALLERHALPAGSAAPPPRRANALAVGAALLLVLLLAAGGIVLAIAAARWLVSKLDGSGG